MDTFIETLKETATFLGRKGYLLPGSSSGNISIRNPNNSDSMIITLSGENLESLKEGDKSFCEVSLLYDEQNELTVEWEKQDLRNHGLDRDARSMIIEGKTFTMSTVPTTKRGKPSFETNLHSSIYKNIERVNAVVHLHSPNSTKFACLNPRILLQIREYCKSSFPEKDVANIVPYTNVARIAKCGPILWCPHFPAASNELYQYVWRALKDNQSIAIILQNHGVVCLGATSMAAAAVAAEIEQELGIILDVLRMSGGKIESLSYIIAEEVEWYWKNISKGNPWTKLYAG